MFWGVRFAERLRSAGAIGQTIIDELKWLHGALLTWGEREHNADGTHGDVTASSVRVAGPTTLAGDLTVEGDIDGPLGFASSVDVEGVVIGPETRFRYGPYPNESATADAETAALEIAAPVLIPDADGTRDLGYRGTTNRRWRNGSFTGTVDAAVLYASSGLFERARSVAAGEWEAYTPTWTNLTVGDGTVVARYTQIGTTVVFSVRITFGSTTSISGIPRVSLPAPLQTSPLSLLGFGDVFAYEDGVGSHSGRGIVSSSTEVALYYGASPLAAISATAPFTWATGDVLHIMGAYERT